MTRPIRCSTLLLVLVTLAACHDPTRDAATLTPDPPPAAAQSFTSFTPSDLRADLDALYAGLEEAHYDLFALTPRPAFDAHHAALRASITSPLDRGATQVLFQRLAAFAHTGHARVEFPLEAYEAFRDAGGKTVPFFVRVIDGRTLIAESYDPDLLVGDEIVALDGEPIATWLERLGAHVSAETPYLEHSLLEFFLPRLMWLERGHLDAVSVEVRRDGVTHVVRAATRSRAEIEEASRAAAPRLELSWTERQFRLLDARVGYLRPGPFYDPTGEDPYDPTSFAQFVDDAFAELIAGKATALLIDLRDNPGGDNSFSDRMIAWFADRPFRFASSFRVRISPQTTASNARRLDTSAPGDAARLYAELFATHDDGEVVEVELPLAQPRAGHRFEGDVYVLVNRHSFSNAVTVAALVQDYGFATILGEETADLATAFGAMEHFELPRTGVQVGYPKAFIVRPNGDETLRGVEPDVTISTPLVEGPEDPVLQRAIEIVRGLTSGG